MWQKSKSDSNDEAQLSGAVKNNVWSILIQVLIAILTALSGVFCACQSAG
jgi:hypothetical protein